MKLSMRYVGLCLFMISTCFSQGISVKTIPLLTTDQFSLVPSFRDDMAGVSIAVRDGVADLFINPAKFDTAGHSQWFLFPRLNHWHDSQETSTRYNGSWPNQNLSQRSSHSTIFSLPFGLFLRHRHLYTAVNTALQHVSSTSEQNAHFGASNYPISWRGGYYVSSLRITIGLGMDYVRIRGIDGVYLLYPNSVRLEQKGSARQFRWGTGGTLANGDQWSLLGSRYFYKIRQTEQNILNKDENDGWLVQADYLKPVNNQLTVGFLITADWRYHPKIPEYPLAGIPRDPGNTRAWNVGLGLKWRNEATLWALDLIYEPIDVKTWADAATDRTLADGQIIHQGHVIMRNDYQFYNRLVRSGVQIQPAAWLCVATGAQVKVFTYDYYQNDFINRSERAAKPQRCWSEVNWTGGIKIKSGQFDVNYTLQLQLGSGLLERQWLWRWSGTAESGIVDFAKADFLIPPTVSLNVLPVTYYTQKVGLRYHF